MKLPTKPRTIGEELARYRFLWKLAKSKFVKKMIERKVKKLKENK